MTESRYTTSASRASWLDGRAPTYYPSSPFDKRKQASPRKRLRRRRTKEITDKRDHPRAEHPYSCPRSSVCLGGNFPTSVAARKSITAWSGHSGIPGNEEADRQANKAREGRGYTVRECIYTSAANRARRISEGRTAAKAKWEADRCTKHYGYRLKGKAGSKRPVPMTSVKSLAARFYRLKRGHAPTGAYLKRFGHREDDICWWCRGGAVQTREHLFRHCSRWKDQQKTFWKTVGKTTGWKAGRC
jgi:hypothetical protein